MGELKEDFMPEVDDGLCQSCGFSEWRHRTGTHPCSGFEHFHKPIDRKKVLELAKSIRESEEAPKLTPIDIDKVKISGQYSDLPAKEFAKLTVQVYALADKVNEIIRRINNG